MKAVLFDLMGTVVPLPPKSRGPVELTECADLLGADPDAFASTWRGSFLERTSGAWGTLPENISRLARDLGLTVTQEQIDAACAARRRSATLVLEPVPDVQAMLERLRAKGIRLAMVTNGAPGLADVWDQSAWAPLFDVAYLSCRHGVMKPDPYPYRWTCEGLGVAPGTALFVGDGANDELTGAVDAGLHAVLVDTPDSRQAGFVPDDWTGPRVTTVVEVEQLVCGG